MNKKLVQYIEENIFPEYNKNEGGHGIEHIKYVINRSLKFAKQFDNINLDMVYTIAAFHDIGHHINKDTHEIISAKIFYEDEYMKQFFTEEQRKIIKEAIEDHRASSTSEPRSNYGKIVSTADRNTDIVSALRRTHEYTVKYFPNITKKEILDRAYSHIEKKFGKDGYAKVYLQDTEFEKYLKDVEKILSNRNDFDKLYCKINNLNK